MTNKSKKKKMTNNKLSKIYLSQSAYSNQKSPYQKTE